MINNFQSFCPGRRARAFKPLHPNINVHIPYTLLYMFLFGVDKENSFEDQSFLGWQALY